MQKIYSFSGYTQILFFLAILKHTVHAAKSSNTVPVDLSQPGWLVVELWIDN